MKILGAETVDLGTMGSSRLWRATEVTWQSWLNRAHVSIRAKVNQIGKFSGLQNQQF